MNTKTQDERFRGGAQDYAAYLETPEGRLRTDLAFANVQEFLPPSPTKKQMHALDVGCGTGAIAVRLARLGFQVTLLDTSETMLDLARRAAQDAGVSNSITLSQSDAAQLPNLFEAASFEVIVCHNVIEYIDDPAAVLSAAARLLRDGSAILSVVARNQAGEVFKSALQAGDLETAETNLTAEWACESLYGGKVRLSTPADLRIMLNSAALEPIATRGIRVLSDYLPARISRDSEYARILELEKKLGSRPDFAAVARYTHCLARRRENEA